MADSEVICIEYVDRSDSGSTTKIGSSLNLNILFDKLDNEYLI